MDSAFIVAGADRLIGTACFDAMKAAKGVLCRLRGIHIDKKLDVAVYLEALNNLHNVVQRPTPCCR